MADITAGDYVWDKVADAGSPYTFIKEEDGSLILQETDKPTGIDKIMVSFGKHPLTRKACEIREIVFKGKAKNMTLYYPDRRHNKA